MNAHTHHGLLVSGGGHALIAVLLAFGYLTAPQLVEMPMRPLELVAAPGSGAREQPTPTGPVVTDLFRPPPAPRVVNAAVEPQAVSVETSVPGTWPTKARPVVKTTAVATPVTKPVARPRPVVPSAPVIPRVNTAELVQGLQAAARQPAEMRAVTDADVPGLEDYYERMKRLVLVAFVKPGELRDGLSAEVAFRVSAGGGVSNARIVRTSGDPKFDAAVLAALARVRLPQKPDGRAEELELTFRAREMEERR